MGKHQDIHLVNSNYIAENFEIQIHARQFYWWSAKDLYRDVTYT